MKSFHSDRSVMHAVSKAGESRGGTSLSVLGNDIWVKVSSKDTEGRFVSCEVRTPSKGGPPLHVHQYEDEWFYVVDGQFMFEVGGVRIPLAPGASLFAPSGTRHTYQNLGDTPGRLLVVAVPGGLDLFLAEISSVVPPGTQPDPDAVLPILEKHGWKLLGPPLSAADTQ